MNIAAYPRYESYQDSGVEWVGAIPESWKVQRGKWLFKKVDRPVRPEDDIVTCFRDGVVTLRANRLPKASPTPSRSMATKASERVIWSSMPWMPSLGQLGSLIQTGNPRLSIRPASRVCKAP
jgi:hypothetical protein